MFFAEISPDAQVRASQKRTQLEYSKNREIEDLRVIEDVELVGVGGWFVESQCHTSGDASHITHHARSRQLQA
jgi:hypothetical protein